MRIFSKKAFAIGPGAQRGSDEINSFITVPGAFQDMPDGYKNDPTFLLAVKAGDITIVDSKATEKMVQEQKTEINDKAEMTRVQAFYEELKVMKGDELEKMAEKLGVEHKDNETVKNFKKRIMEAYKLADAEENGSDEDDSEEHNSEGEEE